VTLAGAKPECLAQWLSRPLTRLLLQTRLTPNQVTAANLLVGLAALSALAVGGSAWGVVGALLLQGYYVLDHCDGEVARARGLTSPAGFWFDRGAGDVGAGLLLARERRVGEVMERRGRLLEPVGTLAPLDRTEQLLDALLEPVQVAGHAVALDAQGRPRPETAVSHVIQRRVVSENDTWIEKSDTRLLPGETAALDIPWGDARRVRIWLEVHPDDFYDHDVYDELLRLLPKGSPAARLIAVADGQARESRFRLFESEIERPAR